MILKKRSRTNHFQYSFVPKLNPLTSIPINKIAIPNTKTISSKFEKFLKPTRKNKNTRCIEPKVIKPQHDYIEMDFDINNIEETELKEINSYDFSDNIYIRKGFLLKLPSFNDFKLINDKCCLMDGIKYNIRSIDIERSLITDIVDKEMRFWGVCDKLYFLNKKFI